MKQRDEEVRGLTRREFLYLSGASIAGMTVAGVPEWSHGAEEKPKYGGRLRIGELKYFWLDK